MHIVNVAEVGKMDGVGAPHAIDVDSLGAGAPGVQRDDQCARRHPGPDKTSLL